MQRRQGRGGEEGRLLIARRCDRDVGVRKEHRGGGRHSGGGRRI